MEKVASGGSLQALGDATNLRPQIQLRPTSLPSAGSLLLHHQAHPSVRDDSRRCKAEAMSAAEPSQRGSTVEIGEAGENAENSAPVAGRKRPLEESDINAVGADEPDGSMVAPVSALPPLKKRQRPSEQRQQTVERQQQRSLSASATAASDVAGSGSPINLVKRECSIPIRCIAEFQQHHFQHLQQQQQQQPHQGYVSVPSELPASELTEFVLNAFSIGGVVPGDCDTKLEIPGWKQLILSDICDDLGATSVGTLLQHVCGVALLRIQLPAPQASLLPSSIIRTLLRSLLPPHATQGSQVLWLKQFGCPLTEPVLEAYLQSPDSFEFTAADRALFAEWHNRMCLQYLEQLAKAPPNLLALPTLPVLPLSIGPQSQAHQQAASAEAPTDATQQSATSSPGSAASGSGQRYGRVRACFDSELELPLLLQWFEQNPHPSRDQLASYRDALNAQPMRRDGRRRPLDSANVAYWFKNMRSSGRRQSAAASAAASALTAAAGPSAPKEAEQGEFGDSSSSSPTPQAPLRLCIEEEDATGTPVATQSEQQQQQPAPGVNESTDSGGGCGGSKRRRTRVFIDPITEIPQLETWFLVDSHPNSAQFQQYAQVLNSMPFRQRQPPLEAKNVQLWFKNHRAKVKRERRPEATADAYRATANAAEAAEPDAEMTGDPEVEIDTMEEGDTETVEEARSQAALELACKSEFYDQV